MDIGGNGACLWSLPQDPTGTPPGIDSNLCGWSKAVPLGENQYVHPNSAALLAFMQYQRENPPTLSTMPVQNFMPAIPVSFNSMSIPSIPQHEQLPNPADACAAPKKRGRPPGSRNKPSNSSGAASSDKQQSGVRLTFSQLETVCHASASILL